MYTFSNIGGGGVQVGSTLTHIQLLFFFFFLIHKTDSRWTHSSLYWDEVADLSYSVSQICFNYPDLLPKRKQHGPC